jgi:hypothetical protein
MPPRKKRVVASTEAEEALDDPQTATGEFARRFASASASVSLLYATRRVEAPKNLRGPWWSCLRTACALEAAPLIARWEQVD